MSFVVMGLNHRTSPLEVRERLSVPSERLPQALGLLSSYFGHAVIVSTCNRTEFYSTAEGAASAKGDWDSFLEALYPVQAASIRRYFYRHDGLEAVRHLFCVASGLDSMLVGETQVLGQVRSAFSAASAAGTVRDPLSRLFHQALRVGKRVHTETRLGRNALSISSACVRLARQTVGPLAKRNALVIGVGEAGKLAARALAQAGVGSLLVTNRTLSRAQELAQQLGAQAVPFEDVPQVLAGVDVVVSATEAPGIVLSRAIVERARGSQPDRRLAVLDIAIPRDVDPAVRSLPNLSLFDLDDLNGIAETHRQDQQEEAATATAIVNEEVDRFQAWLDSLDVVPTVASLRQRTESIRQRELARALRRLAHLPPDQQAVLDAMSRALVQKLLHDPIATIKAQRNPRHLQAMRELFHLSDLSPHLLSVDGDGDGDRG